MSVSLKKPSQAIREITPEHLIDEEETIVKPVRSASTSKSLKIEVVEDKQLPELSEPNQGKKEKVRFRDKMRDFFIDYGEDLLKIVVAGMGLAMIVFMFGLMLGDLSNLSKDYNVQNKAVEAAYGGIIVDKIIENPRSNAFRTTNTEYRLFINVDYYVDGEKKTTKKYFSVSESTYLAYDVGDYFNSHNFTFSDGQ